MEAIVEIYVSPLYPCVRRTLTSGYRRLGGPQGRCTLDDEEKNWWGFHISEDSSRVGRYAVSTVELLPLFRRIIVSSS